MFTLWNICFFFFKGEYYVIGIDIEQYDSSSPEKYLHGLLKEQIEPDAIVAFKSYLAILPSAPIAFDSFARLVSYNKIVYIYNKCI